MLHKNISLMNVENPKKIFEKELWLLAREILTQTRTYDFEKADTER